MQDTRHVDVSGNTSVRASALSTTRTSQTSKYFVLSADVCVCVVYTLLLSHKYRCAYTHTCKLKAGPSFFIPGEGEVLPSQVLEGHYDCDCAYYWVNYLVSFRDCSSKACCWASLSDGQMKRRLTSSRFHCACCSACLPTCCLRSGHSNLRRVHLMVRGDSSLAAADVATLHSPSPPRFPSASPPQQQQPKLPGCQFALCTCHTEVSGYTFKIFVLTSGILQECV
jgi:hypothetical protein